MAPRSIAPLTPMVLLATLALSACNDQTVLAPPGTPSAALARQPGRYLLGFDGTPSITPDVLAASGGQIVDAIPALHVVVVDGVTNPDALRAAGPKYIDGGFDVLVNPMSPPLSSSDAVDALPNQNTPWFKNNVQWDMKAIHADDGWARTSGGAEAKVCIVDTGVDGNQQELSGRLITQANFVLLPAAESDPNYVGDPHGHGTHVAGSAAARGVVMSGVAPAASLLSARVLASTGSGQESWIMKGIMWCADNGAHVINLSLGGTRYRVSGASYTASINAYSAAVKYATDAGAVVVVSAGNSTLRLPNPQQTVVPAQVPGTIIVGATGPLTKSTAPAPPNWDPFNPDQVWRSPDYRAPYSNYGTGVSVFAPGGYGNVLPSEVYRIVGGVAQGSTNDNIWSACSGNATLAGVPDNHGVPSTTAASCAGHENYYTIFAGTSQAAPHVTGTAAVLYGELGGSRSDANRQRIQACILGSTDNIGPSTTYGGGRINVKSAIDALRAHAC